MERRIRNLTRSDFDNRISRIQRDAGGRGSGGSAPRKGHPILGGLLGFGWFYLLVTLALRKPEIADSLVRGTLSPQQQSMIVTALAVLMAGSAVVLALHLFRFIARRRSTSGGLVLGGVAAIGIALLPPAMLDAGHEALEDNARSLIGTAKLSVSELRLEDVVPLSSVGN